MDGRFPEHLILSHDLIESAFARSALVSDVQVVEDYPSSYLADAARRHRWVRGDWQILAWIGPRIPDARGHWVGNPLSALSRWKIFDNLRRTFVPGALVGMATLGWLLQPHAALAWTVLVLGLVILPAAVNSTLDLLRQRREVPLGLHLRTNLRRMFEQATRILLELAFLPHDAHVQLDAAGRSLWRMAFNRKRLMEWRTSGDAERSARRDLLGHVRAMWIGPLLALAVGGGIFLLGHVPALLAAAPLLGLWFAGPVLAWFVSRPTTQRHAELNLRQRHFLREAARLTWRYFEVFVGPDDHHLPPDNFREHPTERIDSRTSPTNMGMALLSNLAAHDFGYIPTSQLIERTSDALGTMEKLERFRGHFYNWYDTRTLETLQPFYVSAVDSGNLVGHLLTLQAGLEELADRPILPTHCFGGLADTHNLYLQTARGRGPLGAARPAAPAPTNLVHRIRRLGAELDQPVSSGRAALSLLREIGDEATEVRGLVEADATTSPELRWWAASFQDHTQSLAEDIAHVAPWLAMDGPEDERDQPAPPLPEELRHLLEAVDRPLTLRELARVEAAQGPEVDRRIARAEDGTAPLDAATLAWLKRFRRNLALGAERAAERIQQLAQVARRCDEMTDADFRFLHNEDNDLLRIGFNVHDHRGDPSYYDLLASEARLASYVAIAQGQLSQDHWFALGRLLTLSDGHLALVSWSGSMFEYLMPMLVMPSYANTLLDRTCRAVVSRQIQYGRQRGVPWGVSESAYSVTDAHHNYQYQAFGVPGLGLKRGLSDDLVVAPYASAMGLMVLPTEATRNLQRLAGDGMAGRYGLYEAVDYTRSRLGRGQNCIPVRLYMAHHSGMTLLSLAHALLDQPMPKRFMRNPWMKAAELLLQERAPRDVEPVYPHAVEARSAEGEDEAQAGGDIRFLPTANTHAPQAHLLSNGRYHVMITNSGGGSSRWEDTAVTRWQADATLDACGQFCYLRDIDTNDTWSATHQPTAAEPDRYEVIFSQGRAEFRRVDHEILSHLEISVSPENDVEIRRLTLTNQSRRKRRIELTSYAEVVLADPRADAAHPAFNKLFVQTQIIADRDGICATRRPRSPGEATPVLLHQMSVRGRTVGRTTFETDRARFIGRGRTLANPAALDSGTALSDSAGSVLDPVVAIRRTVELEPDESATVDMITGIAENQEQALSQLGRYQDYHFANRVLEIAWTHSQLALQDMGITESDAQLFAKLAGAVIYGDAAYRARPSILRSNRLGQSGLWKYGISGDWPIVLVTASSAREVVLIRQVLQAHAYWRRKGLKVDVVIINDDYSGYRQELQDRINALIHAGGGAAWVDKPGGVFVRSGDQMSSEDRTLLQSVARVVLTDTAGSLAEQADRQGRSRPSIGRLAPVRAAWPDEAAETEAETDLLFYNGTGGFTQDGREYVITVGPDHKPPAPWSNVLANERLGSVVSESGSAYTWFENAHEFRLTPWANDPVSDPSGEAIYVRDEHTGQSWSPTPSPTPGPGNYRVRHGFGYSIFEHRNGGIFSELTTYVAVEDPIKFFVLKLRNDSGRARRLSTTGYFEWVLGETRDRTAPHVITELDPQTEAIFARNHYQADFPGRVAFAAVSESTRSLTGDRCEFIGRNGHPGRPEAMERTHLSGRLGAALDPCAALQTTLELGPGQEAQVVFMLGAGIHEEEARAVLHHHQGISGPRQALEAVWDFWKRTLGTVYVETSDKSVDVLVNGWLEYQTLASRVWGRSGFYQSGGAYGFRDQLQDCMALLHAAPATYRRHLLRAAAHQFPEGDVQHWWHPPSGRGVRTRIRDDYLWLPFAAARYVSCTADTGVLEESVPFVNGRAVDASEESYYDLPQVTEQTASLYEHCVRAIEHGLQFGPHGLPLMGCGDWNDGMNEVGSEGTGESVWLGFFLYDVLQRFAPIALSRGDTAFAERCADQAELIRSNLEEHAWDGNWYLRAFFDDGTPLGSSVNAECQIDAIPQAWSALTGAVDPQRSRQAMAAVSQRLIRRDIGIIQLFTPPFDQSDLEPGYIKGYVPGVRENGGQYTHAAVWTTMALAALGDSEAAWECLRMINPVHHADTPQKVQTYKVEPYVMAADIYGVSPHEGRGGWTWYTGSSSWMFRLMVEQLLGLQLEVDHLRFAPCLPPDFGDFRLHYRFRETFYHVQVHAPSGHSNQVARVVANDQEQADKRVQLVDDGAEHQVSIELA
ncbi:MAG: cyclic beta 1-2 glucan synthetase [Phycisphaerae bacterium]|nr:cyclic beta 1-2 glucan synthetase [Phycisphaerae bacterium]